MKPGTLQYINKKFENYHITKHTFDLTDKPTFFVFNLNDDIPRLEIPVDVTNLELYSKFYNKIFGTLQLTLDLDDI